MMLSLGCRRRARLAAILFLGAGVWFGGGPGARGAIYTVLNTADSGAGSFRQAIIDANGNAGADTIRFQIGTGSAPFVISPVSALPAVTDPVVIDATTQTGYVNRPVVELNAASAGVNAALRLLAGQSTVRGLAINRGAAQGILIQTGGTNSVQGCYVGTDTAGTIARGNSIEGIWINGSSGNVIGGTTALERNLISANGKDGVYVLGGAGNVIQGNYIGTAASGSGDLGNGNNGVVISSGAGNRVGGAGAARNVISGNTGSGIYVLGAQASSNLVQGNYIGTDAAGAAALANRDGVTVEGGRFNTIGGAAAGLGNVISGNALAGISFLAAGVSNTVQGNLIGTDVTGRLALANVASGLNLEGGSMGNLVGGNTPAARNVISGNALDGVFITNSPQNIIAGNFIGVDITGTNALRNQANGVEMSGSGASANVVGGEATGAGNVVSGNADGVRMVYGATGNLVRGNYIGTDATGGRAISNRLSGVYIESPGNTIGGSGPGAGNLISGNGVNGVFLAGAGAVNNVIQGNLVGTALGGATVLSNGVAGVGLSGAGLNLVGGALAEAGNLISGNGDSGVFLKSGAWGNSVEGNRIGTDATGMIGMGNYSEGVYVNLANSNNILGNVIASNGTWAVLLDRSSWNVVQGNKMGTAVDGTTPLGNAARLGSGPNRFPVIELTSGSANNQVGGYSAGMGNIIANAPAHNGTLYAGIRMRAGATNNLISGNSIFANAGLGIDLNNYMADANDACDADAGANNAQNFPVLTAAVTGNGTAIRGTLNGAASTAFRLEFFASPACDSLGNGEGQVYLGSWMVATTAGCGASFVATLGPNVPLSWVVTATATDPAQNTSEFSSCLRVTNSVPPVNIRPVPGAGTAVLSWPTNAGPGYAMKQTGSLTPPVHWDVVTNGTLSVSNGWNLLTVPTSTTTNQFFRLSYE